MIFRFFRERPGKTFQNWFLLSLFPAGSEQNNFRQILPTHAANYVANDGTIKTGLQCKVAPGNIELNEVLFIAESLLAGKSFLKSFAYLMNDFPGKIQCNHIWESLHGNDAAGTSSGRPGRHFKSDLLMPVDFEMSYNTRFFVARQSRSSNDTTGGFVESSGYL